VSGVVFVNQAFADSAVDGFNGGFVSGVLLSLLRARQDSGIELLKCGTERGATGTVRSVTSLSESVTFRGRFNIGHIVTSFLPSLSSERAIHYITVGGESQEKFFEGEKKPGGRESVRGVLVGKLDTTDITSAGVDRAIGVDCNSITGDET